MKKDKAIIKNALDANAFDTQSSDAGYVTPEVWERQLLPMLRDELMVSAEAKVYDNLLGASGDTINVTVDAVPGPASTVDESDDVPVTSTPTRGQVVFSPQEYAARYQLSDSQAENSFVQEAQSMQTKLAYSLALKREDEAISVAESTSSQKVYGGNVTAESDLTSGDSLSYSDIVDAKTPIERANLEPYVLFTTPEQYATLLKDQQFSYVDHAGSNSELRRGTIPQVAGVDVFKSNRLTDDAASGDVHRALMFGRDPEGNSPIGFAPKREPRIRVERDEPGRHTDFVASERWDMQGLRGEGITVIATHEG